MSDIFAKGGHYFESFQRVYQYLKKHHAARTKVDIDALLADLAQFESPFEIDLMVAVVTEIERGMKETVA